MTSIEVNLSGLTDRDIETAICMLEMAICRSDGVTVERVTLLSALRKEQARRKEPVLIKWPADYDERRPWWKVWA